MKNCFDLLVFDWDGTLYDSIPFIVNCLTWAARDCGLPDPAESDARAVIGLSLDRAMAELFPAASVAECGELVRAYRRHYEARQPGPDDLFAGVEDMLESLRQAGYRLAVASGKNSAALSHALQATGTSIWFDSLRGPDQTASKPDPRMLREIMADVEARPERTLMIGDSVHDLQMAANADVAAVAVVCGANTRDQLLPFKPLQCLEHTRELLPLLA